MEKKKLLFINGHLNTGGVEKSLLDILLHLDYSKYDVDLLLTEQRGDYAPQLPPQVNVLFRCIEGTYGSALTVLLRSLRQRDWFSFQLRLILLCMKAFGQKHIVHAEKLMIGGRHYDCVVGFRPGICTQLAAFAVKADHRITWWHHGEIIGNREEYLEAAKACDTVVAVSGGCRDMLSEAFPNLKDQLVIVPNMLDLDAVLKRSKATNPYADSTVTHIVSVGRLAPEKHYENVICAAEKLKSTGINFRWHIVGDGICRSALEEKAKQLNVTDCVVFEGNQVNPYPYMKYADLFVHPSYVESFGIVVTEALALGVPCVVTKSTGVMDFLRDGENALLTEQDPDDLAEKVLQALNNQKLRDHLQKNALCPEQFLPDVVMKRVESLLE